VDGSTRRREYTFSEWVRLPDATKRTIMKRDWGPDSGGLGRMTRARVLMAFARAHPQLTERSLGTTVEFSNWGWCIAVIVDDPAVRVPRFFDVFPVVKGLVDELRPGSLEGIQWLGSSRRHKKRAAG